jgi:hypothetical protein
MLGRIVVTSALHPPISGHSRRPSPCLKGANKRHWFGVSICKQGWHSDPIYRKTCGKQELRANGARATKPDRTQVVGNIGRSFDHFVGAGEQKMRDCDLAELACVKRVNFPKAFAH